MRESAWVENFVTVALALATMIVVTTLAIVGVVRAEPVTTYRDNMGRVQGYGSTRGNVTTYSNSLGQQTGRAERRRDGTVHYFNEKGQQIGTARPR